MLFATGCLPEPAAVVNKGLDSVKSKGRPTRPSRKGPGSRVHDEYGIKIVPDFQLLFLAPRANA